MAGAKLIGGGSSTIGMNGGDALSRQCASLNHQGLVLEVPSDCPSMVRVPIECDCMLSDAGLDAGSDKRCGLLSSLLDIGRGGIRVIPTGPDECVLGWV